MTFEQVFQTIIGDYSGKEFLTCYEDGERKILSNRDYMTRTDAVAAYLEKSLKQVEKSSWVGIKIANTPYWFAVFFALLKIGYRVVLLDSNCTGEALQAFREQSGMPAVVSDKEETFKDIFVISFEDAKRAPEGRPEMVCWESELCFCTSGTTGNAKMYVFNADTVNYQSINIADHFLNAPRMVESRGTRTVDESYYLFTQPFRHCLGFGLPLAFWRAGFPCVMGEKPGIYGIAEACRKEKIWMFISVPAVWKALLQMAKSRYGDMSSASLHQLLGGSLTCSASAGAILDETTAARLKAIDISIMNGWGMTETGFVTIGDICDDDALDYVGDYYNKHQAMIKNAQGQLVESGYGELMIRGEAMYDGLIVNGEVIPHDCTEYFATGDIFELQGNSFYFKGRCKSVIIGDDGENIYPEELDSYFAVLSDHVSQYCTAEYNKRPCLYVSTKEYDSFHQQEIFNTIVERNNRLPIGQRIAKVIATPLTFPVTGKAEIARFYIKDFVLEHRDECREYALVSSAG